MIKLIKRYHPERYYMRGPGPKWIEKHCGGNEQIGPAIDDHRRHRQLLKDFFSKLVNWFALTDCPLLVQSGPLRCIGSFRGRRGMRI